jgi:hypothetical protein
MTYQHVFYLKSRFPQLSGDIEKLLREPGNIRRFSAHKNFLIQSYIEDIVPRHLKRRAPFKYGKAVKYMHEVSMNLLCMELEDNIFKIEAKLKSVEESKKRLMEGLPLEEYEVLEGIAERYANEEERFWKMKHERKWKAIYVNRYKGMDVQKFRDQAVVNRTNITFNKIELFILAQGSKFKLKDNENGIQELVDYLRASTKFENVNTGKRLLKDLMIGKVKNKRVRGVIEILRGLKNKLIGENAVIIEADKGGKLVIMYRVDYNNKIKEKIRELGYQRVRNNFVRVTDCKVREVIRAMRGEGIISDEEAAKLINQSPSVPEAIGKIKMHKENEPMRIIINGNDSATIRLEEWFAKKVKNAIVDYDRLKSVQDFVERIRECRVGERRRLIKLDIKDMFLRIPLEIVCEELRILNATQMTDRLKKRVMDVCTKNCVFKFDGELYKMEDGCRIGSPLSQVMADVLMKRVEREVNERLGNVMEFYGRYVDDILIVVEQGKEEEVLRAFSEAVAGRMEYQVEEPDEGGWTEFLGLKLKLHNGKILRKMARSKDRVYNYVKYYSYCPKEVKIGVINNVLNNVKVGSSNEFVYSDYLFYKEKLILNGYPSELIEKIWDKIKMGEVKERREYRAWIKLQYYGDEIGRKIRKDIQSERLGIVFYGNNSIKKFWPSCYERVQRNEQKGVVYRIPCEENCRKDYYGNTGRKLITRVNEHRGYFRRGEVDRNALVRHAYEEEHVPEWTNTRVMDRGKTRWERNVKEAFFRHCAGDQAVNKNDPFILRGNGRTFGGLLECWRERN